MFKRSAILVFAIFIFCSAGAQMGKIPAAVTEAFARQYPAAQQVSYEDNLSVYSVHFVSDSVKMIARYSSKGTWKGSEKLSKFENLSEAVKDGFAKSKYSNWKVKDVYILLLPESAGGGEQYRIRVARDEINKKALYFNRTGKLVRDNVYL